MHENKYERPRNEIVRVAAVIAMTIDHIGAFLLPQYIILRMIGRFAMPVFAYGVAIGMTKTRNREKYLTRLFIFAMISQIPFNLVGEKGLSTISTIFITAVFLYFIMKDKTLFYILSLIPLSISFFIPMDYGPYFLALAFVIYMFKERPAAAFIFGCVLTVIVSLAYYDNPLQIFSIIGLFFACFQDQTIFKRKLPVIRLNKYFFYLYYPIHLVIIYIIKIT